MVHSAILQGYVLRLISLLEWQLTLMEGTLELLLSSSRRATCKLHRLGYAQMRSIQISIQGQSFIRNLL
jgi:hypothetical protein